MKDAFFYRGREDTAPNAFINDAFIDEMPLATYKMIPLSAVGERVTLFSPEVNASPLPKQAYPFNFNSQVSFS